MRLRQNLLSQPLWSCCEIDKHFFYLMMKSNAKAAATSEGAKRLSVEQVRRTGDAGRD